MLIKSNAAKVGEIFLTKKCFRRNFPKIIQFRIILNNKNMESSVKQRLIEFIKQKQISVNSFEKSVGLSTGYVKNISKSIQPEKVQRISQIYPDLNTGWLLTGEGEMLKGAELSQAVKSELESETVRMLLAELAEQRKTIARLTAIIDRLTSDDARGKNDESKAV